MTNNGRYKMNDFTLDDFKIGEVYGFIIGNDQGESEEIKGCVIGHNHIQLENGQADLLMIRNILNKSPIHILLDEIKSYYRFNRDNEDYIDAVVYNPDLDEYNIERGASVKDILSLMINNWEYYDPDTRKDLVCKFSHAVTTDVLIDLITAYADCKKNNAEWSEKYLKVLDHQTQSIDKYNKFRNQIKPFMPKGYDKILDALIFDVCGFGR